MTVNKEDRGVRQSVEVRMVVNGEPVSAIVEPRLLLSDFVRHQLGLTGTHVGCEHGVCGACTVLLDGSPQRSCLIFAVQTDGAELRTVESLAPASGELHPVQQAFADEHGMQCGFCTPGFLMAIAGLLEADPRAGEEEIVDCLAGQICRCTGYRGIVRAAMKAQERIAEEVVVTESVEDD